MGMTEQTYDGAVTAGGDPQTRTVGCLSITKVAVDPDTSNNCYLLRCTDTGEQVLIDAADDASTLLRLVGDGGLARIVTTHQHWDHHRALKEVAEATGAETLAGEPDADAITEQTGVAIDRHLVDGDTVPVGNCSLRVIPLRGHTPGSVALHLPAPDGEPFGHLFTGDSLFPGGVGNTFGDDAAFAQLIDDVETRIFAALPDDTWFYPGHGDDSTIGAERPLLSEWRKRGW